MRQYFYIAICAFTVIPLKAQEDKFAVDSFIESIIEEKMMSEEIENNIEYITESLLNIHQNPINLNTTSSSELSELWILTDFQILSLLDYRKKMGAFVSLNELRLIYGFNSKLVDLISPFVYIGPGNKVNSVSFKDLVYDSKHNILLRLTHNNKEAPNYLGDNTQQYFRYSYKYRDRLQMCFLAEKDGGEKLQKYGYDFYSGYIGLNLNKTIKNITLGDFKIKAGQGLLISNGYSMGKTTEIALLQKSGKIVSGNTSKDEVNFLRGASFTLKYKDFSLLSYASIKNIDAILDTIEENAYIKNIILSGYHRTQNELTRRHNAQEKVLGSSLIFKKKRMQYGINWMYIEYSKEFLKSTLPYKQKDFYGRSENGLSYNYKLLYQKFQVFGEIATTNKKTAFVNGVNFMPVTDFSATIIYRNYSNGYSAPYSNAIKESTLTKNEEGFFVGIDWHTEWKFRLSAYSDIYYHPGISTSSIFPGCGKDYKAKLEYFPSEEMTVSVKYTLKISDKSVEEPENKTSQQKTYKKQNCRLQFRYKLYENITMQTTGVWCQSGYNQSAHYPGFLIYQDIHYALSKQITVKFRYAFYSISDFNSRIYAYEHDLLYSFSVPAYYDNGQRIYGIIQLKNIRRASFWIKYGYTNYFTSDKKNVHELKIQTNIKF